MKDFIIRAATDGDRPAMAGLIVRAFRDDFIRLSKDMDRIARTLQNGIDVERFFIAMDGNEPVGVIACADCRGRAVTVRKADCRKHLGIIKGTVAEMFMAREFSRPLRYPLTTGYIEFVAVAQSARKQGLATKMLRAVMAQTDYREYMLDVSDTNPAAQKCYLKYGFTEVARVKARCAKLKNYNAKVYMKYTGKPSLPAEQGTHLK